MLEQSEKWLQKENQEDSNKEDRWHQQENEGPVQPGAHARS